MMIPQLLKLISFSKPHKFNNHPIQSANHSNFDYYLNFHIYSIPLYFSWQKESLSQRILTFLYHLTFQHLTFIFLNPFLFQSLTTLSNIVNNGEKCKISLFSQGASLEFQVHRIQYNHQVTHLLTFEIRHVLLLWPLFELSPVLFSPFLFTSKQCRKNKSKRRLLSK